MIDTAMQYLSFGWSIIPLGERDKRPLYRVLPLVDGKHGWKPYQERHPTQKEVEAWFKAEPRANLGIVTGAISQIMVQDVDGPRGMSVIQQHGGIPRTPVSRTGRGLHIFYQYPGRETPNKVAMMPGTDLRGDGGYIVAPPSIHPNGASYTWHVEPTAPVAPAPEWIETAIQQDTQWLNATLNGAPPATQPVHGTRYGKKAMTAELDRLAGALRGNRNNTLVRSSFKLGQLVASGYLDEQEVRDNLILVARHIGLAEHEVMATVSSGLKAGMANPRRQAWTLR